MRNWLIAGEIDVNEFVKTSLFSFIFNSLDSEQLFDAAVEVVCELIHETQEVYDNMNAIEVIIPRLIVLQSGLSRHHDDPDIIKGLAKIFAEAGETYRALILQHPETFFPIVEAIGNCSAYPNLDIVPITFPFWMRLAQVIGKKSSTPPLFIQAYKALMNVIIRHLHFPADDATLTGQEAEDFRSFRHVMGDTLKDCCYVLRTDNCLLEAHQMIVSALARGPDVLTWQEIEAPLFAMRSMGAEVDPQDRGAVPKILELIPSLPDHPRVRYAALLIIARYTEWLNEHPEYITAQLQYISAGFESLDVEVSAAAGQALKYVCQDCKAVMCSFMHPKTKRADIFPQHLLDFLPTLHTFLTTTGTKLSHDERRQVYEAIAHVISAMPMERAAESLRTFALDILGQVHALAVRPVPATKEDLDEINSELICLADIVCQLTVLFLGGLENLEVMLHVVQGFGDQLPPACRNTCEEAWAVFDAFLIKYGKNYDVTEAVTRVLRHGISLFGKSALRVVPSVSQRMTLAFDSTGYSSYLWIASKLIGNYNSNDLPDLKTSFREVYEHSTQKIVAILQTKSPGEIPDGRDSIRPKIAND